MGKRGPKTKYIVRQEPQDLRMYLALAKNGVATLGQLQKYCKENPARVQKNVNSGLVVVNRLPVNGRVTDVAEFTKLGQDLARSLFGIQYFPVHNSTHIDHDIKESELYFRLSEEGQRQIIPENEILATHTGINPKTCPDAMTYVTGAEFWKLREEYVDMELLVPESSLDDIGDEDMVLIAVESVGGKDYTKDYIEAKHTTARMLGCKGIMIK